jgi:hypothetical protein
MKNRDHTQETTDGSVNGDGMQFTDEIEGPAAASKAIA